MIQRQSGNISIAFVLGFALTASLYVSKILNSHSSATRLQTKSMARVNATYYSTEIAAYYSLLHPCTIKDRCSSSLAGSLPISLQPNTHLEYWKEPASAGTRHCGAGKSGTRFCVTAPELGSE